MIVLFPLIPPRHPMHQEQQGNLGASTTGLSLRVDRLESTLSQKFEQFDDELNELAHKIVEIRESEARVEGQVSGFTDTVGTLKQSLRSLRHDLRQVQELVTQVIEGVREEVRDSDRRNTERDATSIERCANMYSKIRDVEADLIKVRASLKEVKVALVERVDGLTVQVEHGREILSFLDKAIATVKLLARNRTIVIATATGLIALLGFDSGPIRNAVWKFIERLFDGN